jgi:hypothetical protein
VIRELLAEAGDSEVGQHAALEHRRDALRNRLPGEGKLPDGERSAPGHTCRACM